MLKSLGAEIADPLFKLVSCIQESCEILEDYKKNFITEHSRKTIGLMLHASKILTK